MVEVMYVDEGKTAVLKVGTNEDGHPVVVELGTPVVVKPDEKGSYDLASVPADNVVTA